MRRTNLRDTKSDPRITARIILFREHYAGLGDELEWTIERYRKLCQALQLTEYELAAMLRYGITDCDRWLRKGNFPKPAALNLTLIERAFYPSALKPAIFPCY